MFTNRDTRNRRIDPRELTPDFGRGVGKGAVIRSQTVPAGAHGFVLDAIIGRDGGFAPAGVLCQAQPIDRARFVGAVGEAEGVLVGEADGLARGLADGEAVGVVVGFTVGLLLGVAVGTAEG